MAWHRVGRDPRWGVEPFPFWRAFGRDLAGFGVLATSSLGVGWALNALRARPLPLRYTPPEARLVETVARMPEARPPGSAADWQPISLDEFQAMVSAHAGVSIDARPEAFYTAGHVPGALNLPRETFEKNFAAVRASLVANAGQPVVVYCDEADCQDGELVAGALNRLGFRNLRVFKEGWEEWVRAGLPQATTTDPR